MESPDASGFDKPQDTRPPDPPAPRSSMRPRPVLCQAGAMLRALLLVQSALCVGAGLSARGVSDWLLDSALAAAVGVPATLGWLIVACAAAPWLARLPAAWRLAPAGLLGAAAAGVAWWPVRIVGRMADPADSAGAGAGLMPVACIGAAFGLAVFHWLELRARAAPRAATEARLAELQSRIRPHFLFNTLNAAIALVRVDPARAEQVLEDLSELFRAALEAPEAQSTLGEEIRLARLYLDIERMRFGARLRVEWEVEEGVAGARVPPLVLQPLVENAVRHGVESSAEGGRIHIRANVGEGRAWVQVLNTVAGPTAAGHGIGVASVRERLRLMHDLDAEFEAGSIADGRSPYGYRVRLGVPLS